MPVTCVVAEFCDPVPAAVAGALVLTAAGAETVGDPELGDIALGAEGDEGDVALGAEGDDGDVALGVEGARITVRVIEFFIFNDLRIT